MARLLNCLRLILIGAVVLTPIACSVTGSPADPTSSFLGATIPGLVVNQRSPLNVTVMNTAQSTRVAADGAFSFSRVPPADVRLLFTGSGVNAVLPLGTLREGEATSIRVAVSGNSATLQSPPSSEPMREVELEGPISNLAGSCPTVTFSVRSERVATTAATAFHDVTCAALRNGMVVEVEGPRQADGVIGAVKVEVEDGDDEDDEEDDDDEEEDESEIEGRVSGLGGTCPNRTFLVAGRNVETTSVTVFRGVACGTLQNGQIVEVEGSMMSGILRARKVELEDDDD